MGIVHRPRRPPPWSVHLDPAKRRCGISVFQRDRLYKARTIHAEPLDLPREVVSWAGGMRRVVWTAEIPEVYEQDRAAAKDLDALILLVDRISARVGPIVRVQPPSQWKGNLKKKATIHRVKKRLQNSELDAMLDLEEDTWEAVGIGLWYTGRVNRGLVLPGR